VFSGDRPVDFAILGSKGREPRMSHQPLVMIVEDDDDTLQMYATGLSLAGYNTLQATNAPDAMRAAREARPDVIVTDVGLRGPMDGIELTRELRSDACTGRVGIIVVTGWSGTALVADASGAGSDAVLTKPCLPDDLVAEVRRVIACRALRPDPSGGTSSARGHGGTSPESVEGCHVVIRQLHQENADLRQAGTYWGQLAERLNHELRRHHAHRLRQ
jgi:two-component system, cell cycle response regulator DivK